MKNKTSTTNELGNNANLLLCPVIFEDDNEELEDDYEDTEPDYYVCMCCGNVQQSSMDCNKCCGPVSGQYL